MHRSLDLTMRELNKHLRRKLENKKKSNHFENDGGKRKEIVKPTKYRKQELENSIDEYYRNYQ